MTSLTSESFIFRLSEVIKSIKCCVVSGIDSVLTQRWAMNIIGMPGTRRARIRSFSSFDASTNRKHFSPFLHRPKPLMCFRVVRIRLRIHQSAPSDGLYSCRHFKILNPSRILRVPKKRDPKARHSSITQDDVTSWKPRPTRLVMLSNIFT